MAESLSFGCWSGFSLPGANRGLGHQTALDAAGADTNRKRCAFVEVLDALQIWQPAGTGLDVRMADLIASRRTLAAEVTYTSHGFDPFKL